MGFSLTSLAVRGGARDAVLAALGLRGTNTHEESPESDITGASLPSGWYLVLAAFLLLLDGFYELSVQRQFKPETLQSALICF